MEKHEMKSNLNSVASLVMNLDKKKYIYIFFIKYLFQIRHLKIVFNLIIFNFYKKLCDLL